MQPLKRSRAGSLIGRGKDAVHLSCFVDRHKRVQVGGDMTVHGRGQEERPALSDSTTY